MKPKPTIPSKEKEIDQKLKIDLTYDEINKYQAFYNDYFNAVDQQPIKLESLKELLINAKIVLLDCDLNQLKEFLISKKIETIDFAVFKAIASLLKEKGLLNHDDVTEDFIDAFMAMGAADRNGTIKKERFKSIIEEFGFNIDVEKLIADAIGDAGEEDPNLTFDQFCKLLDSTNSESSSMSSFFISHKGTKASTFFRQFSEN